MPPRRSSEQFASPADVPDEAPAPDTPELYSCWYCGNEYDVSQRTVIDGRSYCASCTTTCGQCATVLPAGDTVRIDDNTRYCVACYEEAEYQNCYQCGNSVLPDYQRDVWSSDYANTFCDDCADTAAHWCERCDRLETGRCPERSRLIHDYDYRPTVKFQGRDPHGLYLGWELEVELPCEDGDEVEEFAERLVRPTWAIIKHDGSLDHGVEFVSQPMAFSWLKQRQDEITAWLMGLRRQRVKSYDTSTCGMHVHLSREAFTSLHQYKFLKLVYDYPDLTLAVSQRKRAQLDQWASLTTDNEMQPRIVRKVLNKTNDHDKRYVAVNMENDATLELRIFRGTLKPSSFFKNLEYCHAAWNFTRDRAPLDITRPNFLTYVDQARKEYPHLAEFLREMTPTCV